jgi:hypothetical protein
MLDTTDFLLEWPDDQPLSKHDIWRQVEEGTLRSSRHDLQEFQRLAERGYGDLLLNRYPSLRKYFADFLHLPFAAKQGNEHLIHAIHLVRKLDVGELKRLPPTAPSGFVPKELRRALKDQDGQLNRNAWEQPQKHEVKAVLTQQFHEASDLAKQRFAFDDFAEIHDGTLKLKRDDKIALPPSVTTLQKVIDSRLPSIRIE